MVDKTVAGTVDTIARGLAKTATQGPPGKSAYEVAVDNGFVGTEAEWLGSLLGDPAILPGHLTAGSLTINLGPTVLSGLDTALTVNGQREDFVSLDGSAYLGIRTPDGPGSVDSPSIVGVADFPSGPLKAWRIGWRNAAQDAYRLGTVGTIVGWEADDFFRFAPGSTSNPSIKIPEGVAPTSPVNGDVWATSAGIVGRVGGVTVGISENAITNRDTIYNAGKGIVFRDIADTGNESGIFGVGLGTIDTFVTTSFRIFPWDVEDVIFEANLTDIICYRPLTAPGLLGINTGDQDLSGLATVEALGSGLAARELVLPVGDIDEFLAGDKTFRPIPSQILIADVGSTANFGSDPLVEPTADTTALTADNDLEDYYGAPTGGLRDTFIDINADILVEQERRGLA